MSRLTAWPRIQVNLRRLREDIGYLSLQTYNADRKGEQLSRLDMSERMLRHWLEVGPDDEDDEENLDATLAALSEDVPQFPADAFSVLDDELKVEITDPSKEPPREKSDEEKSEEILDALEEDDEEDDEDDDVVDTEEDTEEPEAAASSALSVEKCESAIRKWILATCESNTLEGQKGRFRLRFYRPKGEQLWSTLVTYHSAASPPYFREGHTIPSPHSAPQFGSYGGEHPSPPPVPPLSASPLDRLSELMNMTDPFDPTGENGAPFTPKPPTTHSPYPAQTPQRAEQQAKEIADGVMRPSSPAPYEVETLMHLHGLHRVFAAMSLNMAKQVQNIYAGVIEQVSGALHDAREHNDDLLGVVQQLRLAEIEKAVDYADRNDKSQVKAVLGQEAIQQMGFLGRTFLQRQNSISQHMRAPHEGPIPENGIPTNGGDPMDAFIPAPMGEEQEPPLDEWVAERPDVEEALNSPAVREYLRSPENVQQLKGLAQMLTGVVDDPALPPDMENAMMENENQNQQSSADNPAEEAAEPTDAKSQEN